MKSVTLCVGVLMGALLAAPAHAQDTAPKAASVTEDEPRQIYGYVDQRGAWHFVDSLALVPLAYRNQARANATRVDVLTADAEPAATPTVTRRVVARDEVDAGETATRVARDRAVKIATLQKKRNELMESVAALEEGSAPATLIPEGDDEPITDERLETFLTDTEEELDRVERELKLLGALR